MTAEPQVNGPRHGVTNAIVRSFLHSNLSVVLILLATLGGVAALIVTPREEDPQIVVPMADVFVDFSGHSAKEVEQLVTTPLEQILYHIDGVEHVYSMSKEDHAVITVRFFVGEDRERSLVKLFKKIDENQDRIPPGVAGWVIKPVEIDDVPIVTLTLTGDPGSGPLLRRLAEEAVERLASVRNVSRAYVVGGEPRIVTVWIDPARLAAHGLAPLEVQRALTATNVTRRAGAIDREDSSLVIEVGDALTDADGLRDVVVGVFDGRPVFVKDVARVEDNAREPSSYVRHGWGPAIEYVGEPHAPGSVLGHGAQHSDEQRISRSAVTIAVAKKKGTNAVWVADDILREFERIQPIVLPSSVQAVVTRNFGLTANEKVNELIESLGIAIVIVVAVLTLGLGWRESMIVCVAVPVVFGLTLFVNLLAGYSINRVTLFALILSLGLLVDDPIVDVENVARHFRAQGRATRAIVLQAIAEIRPPLIVATLAVIVSFLPMFFITGMMGPYMRPMALNVPVAMLMSMLVAFTITPWLSYHVLRRRYAGSNSQAATPGDDDLAIDPRSRLNRLFRPLMTPMLRSRRVAGIFLVAVGLLTVATMMLAAVRAVPLKMLPFGNKNQLQLVLDFDEGTTLERADAAVRDFETYLATVPEVTCFTSYVGTASPMDFNGLVRHYYLRAERNVADIVVNLAPKKSRSRQSHSIALAIRPRLTELARQHGVALEIVEVPPGPPTIAPVVAEVYGRPDHAYDDLIAAARTVRKRLSREPSVVDIDDSVEADHRKLTFVVDSVKAAVNGTSVSDIAATVAMAVGGDAAGVIHADRERNPLQIMLQMERADRSTPLKLTSLQVTGQRGSLVPLAELGRWEERQVNHTIYHKDLRQVVYVFADTAGRPPTDAVVDVLADRVEEPPATAAGRGSDLAGGWVDERESRPLDGRTFLANGSGIRWSVPPGVEVKFAGEGELQMTLDVFRDLGIAFVVALVGIYVLLVAQMRSFAIPVIVMLAIPLTVLGIMPGFWLLNQVAGGTAGGYSDPIFFTATAMIGMIALAGIVTRQSVILIDFIHLALARGRSLSDAIIASCVVRMRPILLTAGTAMLSAIPIAVDPVFSGLAWALIFGLVASTAFTLFVVPITYWLVYERRPGHGVPVGDQVEL